MSINSTYINSAKARSSFRMSSLQVLVRQTWKQKELVLFVAPLNYTTKKIQMIFKWGSEWGSAARWCFIAHNSNMFVRFSLNQRSNILWRQWMTVTFGKRSNVESSYSESIIMNMTNESCILDCSASWTLVLLWCLFMEWIMFARLLPALLQSSIPLALFGMHINLFDIAIHPKIKVRSLDSRYWGVLPALLHAVSNQHTLITQSHNPRNKYHSYLPQFFKRPFVVSSCLSQRYFGDVWSVCMSFFFQ